MTIVDADTGEVVNPAALVPLPADPAALDQYADPGAFIELACERAKQWLVSAVEHGDIDQIVELKSQAEAIRTYTAQKQLGKDAELAAAEIVRRAERGIGIAIRKGQEAGEIARKGDSGAQGDYERGGVTVRGGRVPDVNKRSPSEFFSGGKDTTEVYAMTDGVSDDQFEEAVAEAKAEGNLSRANVVRKVKGEKAAPKKNGRHDVQRNTRHVDPNRVVDGLVNTIVIPLTTFDLLDGHWSELDRDHLAEWLDALVTTRARLSRLINNLREERARG